MNLTMHGKMGCLYAFSVEYDSNVPCTGKNESLLCLAGIKTFK